MSRPYFETKIVKVKKEKKECKHSHLIQIQDMPYRVYQCANCGYYLYPPLKKDYLLVKGKVYEQEKGNWVNDENLDKIKFPCLCSYSDGEGSERKKGFISMNEGRYYIADINTQKKVQRDIANDYTLKALIIRSNIHILKGKIIIFEEVKH